jgi:hypothetical protein
MVSFVKAVYTGLNANGYYVALNAGAFKSGDTSLQRRHLDGELVAARSARTRTAS